MSQPVPEQLSRTIETLYRSESGRVLATLVRLLGDLDLAEESMHEAFAAALESWTLAGIPDKPRPWLISTARFKAIDAMRRRARFDGAQGDLVAHLNGTKVSWHRPFAFQETQAGRKEIPSRFTLKKNRRVGFEVASYDHTKPLIIDPALVYATYLGGTLTLQPERSAKVIETKIAEPLSISLDDALQEMENAYVGAITLALAACNLLLTDRGLLRVSRSPR